jgi:peptidoglycan DL-endopeptidase CwlO
VAIIGLLGPQAVAHAATASPATASPATASPAMPSPNGPTDVAGMANVPTTITDGTPAQTLLDRAQALTAAAQALDAPVSATASAAASSPATTAPATTNPAVAAAQTALNAAVATLDADTVMATQDQGTAARARRAVTTAGTAAQQAGVDYRGLDASLKAAAIRLYMDGPTARPDLAPGDIDQLLVAGAYEQTALTPEGILARRHLDVETKAEDLATARSDATTATATATRAAAALAAATTAKQQLASQLSALQAGGQVPPAAVAAVSTEADSVAAQAGTELTSASSLEFTPSSLIPPPVATTDVALDWAFAELGKEYVWGGSGPDTFDCSGLTQYVWNQAGVAIPRVAADQDAWTIPVPLSQLLPGDLVFYGTTDIHHVGMYIGDGLMINAPHTGTVVQVSSIWWSDLSGFGRVHAGGVPVPTHQIPDATAPATPVVTPDAGPVPSQATPPPGSDILGSTLPPGTPSATTTTTTGGSKPTATTAAPTTPASAGTPTTTVPPASTTTTTLCPVADTTTTSAPDGSTTSTSTTTSTSSTTTIGDGEPSTTTTTQPAECSAATTTTAGSPGP